MQRRSEQIDNLLIALVKDVVIVVQDVITPDLFDLIAHILAGKVGDEEAVHVQGFVALRPRSVFSSIRH